MKEKIFDRALVRNPEQGVDFIGNILESSTEYSIIGKALDGKILLWNEEARRLYGYEPEEVVGKVNASILQTPEGVRDGKHHELIEIALMDGKWEGIFSRVRKNGAHLVARGRMHKASRMVLS